MKKHFVILSAACVLGATFTACTPSASTPSIPAATVASATSTPGATPTPAPGSTATPAPAGTTSTSFVISLNGGGETILSKNRHPQFVSPSTQSISFAIDGGTAATQNLSPSATNCADANGGVRCTIPLASVAAGKHTLALTAWSGTNGTGNKLGANSSIAFTVVANQANTVSGIIGGIATGINIVPVSGATGSMTQGFTIYASTTPASFIANPVDASGNTIVGPGSPAITATMNSSSATAAMGITQNTFTIADSAGDTQPILTNLGQLDVQLTPVVNSGGTALSTTVGIYGEQPRIYVLGTNNEVVSYDELGNLQTNPGASDTINNTPFSTTAIAWDDTSSLLIAATATSIQSYVWTGDNVANFLSQGTVTPARAALAWDDVSQLAYEYDATTSKLVSVGPWPNPATLTELGSATTSGYSSLTSCSATVGGGQQQDCLWAAMDTSVLLVQPNGTSGALAAPGVGTIGGLAYDPATGKLFVAGSTGVTYYTFQSLSSSPGFSGVTGATGIALNPANGLVYVAEGGASKIAVFNEAGVAQFSFSTGSIQPQQIIAVP